MDKVELMTHLKKFEDGVGWTDLTSNLPWSGEMITYGGNMLVIKVKPDDENTIFLGTVGLYRSTDGGQAFELIGAYGSFHVDQHAIVFYPSDPKVMIVGNDGGLFKTNENSAEVKLDPKTGEQRINWESLNNGYLTTQFYSVAIDHATPGCETISGGMQDNGCMFTNSVDPQVPWISLIWGDGGYSAISDGGEYHYTSLGATFRIWRHSFPNGEHRWTDVTPTATKGGSIWLPPFILDPHDTRIMYLPWRTQLWRNSDLTQIEYVFPPTPTDVNWTQLENVKDHYISALGMSKAEPRRLYYASIYGDLFKIDDPHEGQPVPEQIPDQDLPPYAYIHCIAVDPTDANKVIVVLPNYGIISIYASENGGNTWTPISGNLEENPDGSGDGPSVRWVSILYVEHKPVYFAGTSVGLFSTAKLDGMNTVWVQEGVFTIGNLVIDMIDVRHSDGFVVVGTHGNGVYSTYVTEVPSGLREERVHPNTFKLYPAYPSPFNLVTHIPFILSNAGLVKLKVYNVVGEEVSILIDGYLQAGEHNVQWTADGMASGIYFIRLDFEGFFEIQKVLLQK